MRFEGMTQRMAGNIFADAGLSGSYFDFPL
jgi:hypothetical protein